MNLTLKEINLLHTIVKHEHRQNESEYNELYKAWSTTAGDWDERPAALQVLKNRIATLENILEEIEGSHEF